MCRPQVFEIDRRDETRRARERDLVATGPTDDGVLDPGDLGGCVQHVELVMAEGEKVSGLILTKESGVVGDVGLIVQGKADVRGQRHFRRRGDQAAVGEVVNRAQVAGEDQGADHVAGAAFHG